MSLKTHLKCVIFKRSKTAVHLKKIDCNFVFASGAKMCFIRFCKI